MNAQKELEEIFGHIKAFIMAYQDMGLEPPALSPAHINFLKADQQPGPLHDPDQLDAVDSLEALQALLGDCQKCKLHQFRTQLVFGEGPPHARLVFVGEGPGLEEDRAGRPFVGEAGKLLTRIIQAMGLTRQDVYICNVVKCHPPKNREPEADEVERCMPFLKRQLQIIRPAVLCTLGRVAGKALQGENFKITQARGKWASYMGLALMPTFHPAYLLRHPSAKRQVWEDVQQIMAHLGLEVKKNER